MLFSAPRFLVLSLVSFYLVSQYFCFSVVVLFLSRVSQQLSAANIWRKQHIGCYLLLLLNIHASGSLYPEVELFPLVL